MTRTTALATLLLSLPTLPCLAEDAPGPLAELGSQLAEHGIKTHAVFLSLALKNLDTGPRPHSFGNSGDLFLGADLDLGKMTGLDGAALHIEQTQFILDRNTGQPTSRNWQGRRRQLLRRRTDP